MASSSQQPRVRDTEFREVWSDNLEYEIKEIQNIVNKYPYIAMDTEFPGTLYNDDRPEGVTISNHCYEMLHKNVNGTNLIQLGLTFSNEQGELPICKKTDNYIVWQFNFRDFDVDRDKSVEASIELLTDCGINFQKNKEKGIDGVKFAELLMPSGILMNDSVQWVTFDGRNDIGYLIKLLIGKNLPDNQNEFLELIKTYFPILYDIKHLMKFCNLHGGLEYLADYFKVDRVGPGHQAGSDSLLTCRVFKTLQRVKFGGSIDKNHSGVVHKLGPKYDVLYNRWK